MNYLASSPVCENHEDLKSCQIFVFDNDRNAFFNSYQQEMSEIKDENNNKSKTGVIILIVLLSIVAVIGLVGIVVIVIKRRR